MPEDIEITKKTRFLNANVPCKNELAFNETAEGLVFPNIKLLAEGEWTDSAVQTPLFYPGHILERDSGNWESNGIWARHSGRTPRPVYDKVGEVRNPRGMDRATVGDLLFYNDTPFSQACATQVKNGHIDSVSVEHGGEEVYNQKTKRMEASKVVYYGLALVDRGACEICKFPKKTNEASEPTNEVLDMTPEEVSKQLADLEAKLKADFEAKIAELSKTNEEAMKLKADENAKLLAERDELAKKLADIERSISDKDKALSEAAEKIKELSELPKQPKTLDPKGDVKENSPAPVKIRKGSIEVPGF